MPLATFPNRKPGDGFKPRSERWLESPMTSAPPLQFQKLLAICRVERTEIWSQSGAKPWFFYLKPPCWEQKPWSGKRSSSSSGSVISEFEPGDNQLHDTDRATELIPFLCLRSLNARRFYLPGPRMSVIYFTTFLRDLVCISSFEPELKLKPKLKPKLKLIRCSIILKFFIRFSWLLPRTSFLWLPFHPKLIYCSRDNFLFSRKKTFAMESRLHHNDKLVFLSTKKLK